MTAGTFTAATGTATWCSALITSTRLSATFVMTMASSAALTVRSAVTPPPMSGRSRATSAAVPLPSMVKSSFCLPFFSFSYSFFFLLIGKTVHKQCGFCTANHEEDWKEKISVSKKGKTKVVTPFSYDYFCGGCISAFLSLPEDKCKFCGNTSICKDCITLDDKGRCPSCAKKNRVMCPRCNVNSIVPGEGLEFCTACFIREEMQKEREKVKSA